MGTCIAAFQNIYVPREVVDRGKGANNDATNGRVAVGAHYVREAAKHVPRGRRVDGVGEGEREEGDGDH